MNVVARPLRPQAWHVAVIAAALVTVLVAIDHMYRTRAEQNALLVVDAAMVALRAKIEGQGPVRATEDTLFAGTTPLAASSLVDEVQAGAQIGATIFFGDVRIATTAHAARGPDPAIGTRSNPQIRAHVLDRGHAFRGLTRTIGKRWVIRYEPLVDAQGHRVGMLATFIDHEDLLSGLSAFRFLLGGTLLVLFTIVAALWIASGRFATALERQASDIEDRNKQLEAAAEIQRIRETELEAARTDAEAQRHAAEAASRAKSLFLANMSHELRTPLNAIIGYGEMLLEEAEHPEAKRDLERIVGASRHLLAVISDILDVSKVEAGRMELDIVDFDLQRLLSELVDATRPLIKANDNKLRVRMDPKLRRMESDPTRVRQILFNLLSNAAKFTQAGRVDLVVEHTLTIHGPGVRFLVVDTGIGMSERQRRRVFAAFVQADASHTRRYGGTGLGLTIVRLLAERLDGRVTVDSEQGRGSTFVVELPLRISELRRTLERPTVVPA